MSDNAQNERARRLGRELRAIRAEQNLTLTAAAQKVKRSLASLSRIENGKVNLPERDLVSLLLLYGVTDEEKQARLRALCRPISGGKRWETHRSTLATSDLFSLELLTTRIRSYEYGIIPGLLQIREYAEAVWGAGPVERSRQEIKRLTDVRLARQAILSDPEPPEFHFIIGEAALRQRVGSHLLMHEQVVHLLEVMAWGHVLLQLLPLDLGIPPGTVRGFVILDVPGMGSVPFTDSLAGSSCVEGETEILRYNLAFDRLQSLALSQEATRTALEEVVSTLEPHYGS